MPLEPLKAVQQVTEALPPLPGAGMSAATRAMAGRDVTTETLKLSAPPTPLNHRHCSETSTFSARFSKMPMDGADKHSQQ